VSDGIAALASAVGGSEWSASCHGCFILGKKLWCTLDKRLGGSHS